MRQRHFQTSCGRSLLTAFLAIALAMGMVPSSALASQEVGRLSVAKMAMGASGEAVAQAVSLRSVLNKASYYPIRYFKYLNKAKTQAVGVTGSLDSNGGVTNGSVWLVKKSGARWLHSGGAFYKGQMKLYKVKGGHIFKVEQGGYGSGSTSYAWFFKGGEAARIPSIGMSMKRVSGNQFSVIRQAFDNAIGNNGSHTGHTYNAYYYRWNGKRFVEYGGKAISQSRLKKAKNGAKILKAIKRQAAKQAKQWRGRSVKIGRIYYRANNIVNVNYSFKTKYDVWRYNVKLRYNSKSDKLSYVKVWSYGANALGRATEGGWYAARGGSDSGSIGVSYPKGLPAGLRR